MRILAPTIMHSGSHALWYGILKDWMHRDVHPYKEYNPELETNACLIGHLTDKQMLRWKSWFGKEVCITMLRHPSRVLASHYIRGECDDRWLMWYNQCWLNHMWLEDHYKPHTIHIDVPELRDHQLALINDELDLSLEFNWPMNGKMGCTGNEIKPVDDMFLQKTPQAYIDYYERVRDAYEA